MASKAQIAANQHNAQLSTGPNTAPGKNKVRQNALKTSLTGHTVLLPSDDAELYGTHVESFRSRYNPIGDAETELVQSIADTAWRLARIPSLEASLFALGRFRCVDLHKQEEDSKTRQSLIDAEILLTFERQFRNLSTQETRLRRQREKDEATLKETQELRARQYKKRLSDAAYDYIQAVKRNDYENYDLGKFGFEFSIGEIEAKALAIYPRLFVDVREEPVSNSSSKGSDKPFYSEEPFYPETMRSRFILNPE